ncbi:transcriptional antiterminator of lichenan operon [Shouchella clausii KSM-K16]|uniref:Transcriptional antiterminator of lichenan operon n=2 Tax=Shouchella clausii TaxID=79880 RepID=Q5WKS9_SHOC1|nr:transcriptional antiterminator of lichenan operon [Shouchella clausii KSM-K16]
MRSFHRKEGIMNQRLQSILRELLGTQGYVTSRYLASVNQVTPRTVREDVKQLQTELANIHAGIESVPGKGYKLTIEDEAQFRQFLQRETTGNHGAPISPEERVTWLIQKLLLAEEYIKLDDLADDLFISKSSLQNDLKNAKLILARYGLQVATRPNYGLYLKGDELKRRFCMAEYVFERKNVAADLTSLQLTAFMKEEQLADIWDILVTTMQENGVTLSDIAINNLFIHIVIAFKRIEAGHHISLYRKDMSDICSQHEYYVAQKMIARLNTHLGVSFPEMEIAYIAIHLLGTRLVAENEQANDNLKKVFDDEYYKLAKAIVEKVERELDLNIANDQELLVSLMLHLKPAINRYRYGMNIRNPMLADIKQHYTLAFEAAVIGQAVIKDKLGISIDENEIGYLALHIGAALERRNQQKEPKRILIVCASGRGSAQLLKYKLEANFKKRLFIVDTTEYYQIDQADLTNIDLIVTSIPIKKKMPVPVVEVNTILGTEDLERIEIQLRHGDSLLSYTEAGLVFLQQSLKSKEDVLRFLDKQLRERGVVSKGFYEALVKRENLASTAYGNLVAIPHPITPQTEKTFLAFVTLKEPVSWNGKPVQLVCLLCVKQGSTEDLERVYNQLLYVLDHRDIVQECIKAEEATRFLAAVSQR